MSLTNKHPGNMVHARWLTTANRIVRLYVATESPDENLLLLVKCTLKVYAEMWLRVRCKPRIQLCPAYLFPMLNVLRDLDDSKIVSLVTPVIQGKAFFTHSDNVLLAMISHERPHGRELALERNLNGKS